MSDFKSRLLEEQVQLNDKVGKLENFIMDKKFENIDEFQQTMLSLQLSAMTTYLQCLNARIKKL